MTHIYLANDSFSEVNKMFNKYLANEIRGRLPEVDLCFSQENPDINSKYADSKQIHQADNRNLDKSDIMIAIIDGCEIDPGVSCEIGRYTKLCEEDRNKIILGLLTDSRQKGSSNKEKLTALVNDPTENQFVYRNLYVIGAIKSHGILFSNIDSLLNHLEKIVQ